MALCLSTLPLCPPSIPRPPLRCTHQGDRKDQQVLCSGKTRRRHYRSFCLRDLRCLWTKCNGTCHATGETSRRPWSVLHCVPAQVHHPLGEVMLRCSQVVSQVLVGDIIV